MSVPTPPPPCTEVGGTGHARAGLVLPWCSLLFQASSVKFQERGQAATVSDGLMPSFLLPQLPHPLPTNGTRSSQHSGPVPPSLVVHRDLFPVPLMGPGHTPYPSRADAGIPHLPDPLLSPRARAALWACPSLLPTCEFPGGLSAPSAVGHRQARAS